MGVGLVGSVGQKVMSAALPLPKIFRKRGGGLAYLGSVGLNRGIQ